MGTLEVVYDYAAVAQELTRDSLNRNRETTHWRYIALLPVEMSKKTQLSVGWTPLYRSSTLEKKLGIERIWIKDEGRNPTGSLKDRASSVGVIKAKERGATIVTAASSGNTASSWAAFSALAGLSAVIFIPKSTPKAKLAQMLLYDAKVLQVKGTYDDAFTLCAQVAQEWGWYNRSTATNPYLGEGKKTAALEICEQLIWETPDYIFVPVGDGCILQGIWKGFKEAHQIGLIDRLPKMVGVQAEGSAPLFKAWQERKKTAEPLEPHTLADSISVGVPRDQVKALRAVRESGGSFTAVSDDEILAAVSTLASDVGVLAEPAGAAGFAGLRRLADDGRCSSQDRVVVMVTGNGLKDIDGLMKATKRRPTEIENSIDDVRRSVGL